MKIADIPNLNFISLIKEIFRNNKKAITIYFIIIFQFYVYVLPLLFMIYTTINDLYY